MDVRINIAFCKFIYASVSMSVLVCRCVGYLYWCLLVVGFYFVHEENLIHGNQKTKKRRKKNRYRVYFDSSTVVALVLLFSFQLLQLLLFTLSFFLLRPLSASLLSFSPYILQKNKTKFLFFVYFSLLYPFCSACFFFCWYMLAIMNNSCLKK